MSNKEKNQESEVYILGTKGSGTKRDLSKKRWRVVGVCAILLVFIAFLVLMRMKHHEYYFEPENQPASVASHVPANAGHYQDAAAKGFIVTIEETVNDVPLLIYTPYNAEMSLVIGMPEKTDSTVVFLAQAADIRADNHEIVGEFVLAGKQLARGTAKTGFCAVIDGNVSNSATKNFSVSIFCQFAYRHNSTAPTNVTLSDFMFP